MSSEKTTTTGALASGADAVVIPRRVEVAINSLGACLYDEGFQAGRTGKHIDDSAAVSACLRRALYREIAAALAAPAPVVPEEVRRLSEAATQGEWSCGDNDGRFIKIDAAGAGRYPPEQNVKWSGLARFITEVDGRPHPTGEANAIFAVAAVNFVRAMISATPSKPVGDGPEASAPPARGGVVEALRGIADDYMTSERHHPGYVLIPAAKFDQLRAVSEALPPAPQCGAYPECCCNAEGKCGEGFPAAPAAPEPAAGGEREGDDWRLVQMMPLTPSLMTPELGAAASQVDLAGCQLILARQVRPVLSAPSEAETAGGDGWRFDMEAAPRDGTPILVAIESFVAGHDPVVGEAYFDSQNSDWWWAGESHYEHPPINECASGPYAWKLLDKAPPKPTPANAVAKGGQHADR